MNASSHHHFDQPQVEPDRSLDFAPVATILAALDQRPGDPVARAAASIIRSLEVQILSLDAEIVDAEWRAISRAVEIERMADHRYALAIASDKRRAG